MSHQSQSPKKPAESPEVLLAKANEVLARLAEADKALASIQEKHAETRNSAIPEDVREVLEDIDEEYEPMLCSAKAVVDQLKKEAQPFIEAVGKSVPFDYFNAVFSPAQPKWNEEMLEGMMALIPELSKARSMGKPKVQFRGLKS